MNEFNHYETIELTQGGQKKRIRLAWYTLAWCGEKV